jgi:hypothetical protein
MNFARTRSHSQTHASNLVRGFSKTQLIFSILDPAAFFESVRDQRGSPRDAGPLYAAHPLVQ